MTSPVSLYRSLETPVSWRTDVAPCIILTAGINNRVTLQLHNSPDSKEAPALSAGGLIIRLYEIPVFNELPVEPVEASIGEGDTGVDVSIRVPQDIPRGYYRAQVARWSTDKDNIDDIYHCWVVVDKQLNPTPDRFMDINSIRSQFADVCSLDNKMLESLEVSAGDIAAAVCRCLEQWRDTAPRVSSYNGYNFPYPEILRNGVLYTLIQSLWTFLERNRMQYQAGGVSVDLERRADSFLRLKQEYEQLWRVGMQQAKMQENVMSFDKGLWYE